MAWSARGAFSNTSGATVDVVEMTPSVVVVTILVVVGGNRVSVGAVGSELEQPERTRTPAKKAERSRFMAYPRLRLLWYQIRKPIKITMQAAAIMTVADPPGAPLISMEKFLAPPPSRSFSAFSSATASSNWAT